MSKQRGYKAERAGDETRRKEELAPSFAQEKSAAMRMRLVRSCEAWYAASPVHPPWAEVSLLSPQPLSGDTLFQRTGQGDN